MTLRMKAVDQKERVREELPLSSYAIWAQCTREIIDNTLWGLWPTRPDGREYVVAALSRWNAMKSVTDAVRTPRAHNPAGQSTCSVGRVELVTRLVLLPHLLGGGVVLQPRIARPESDLRHAIKTTSLDGTVSLEYFCAY